MADGYSVRNSRSPRLAPMLAAMCCVPLLLVLLTACDRASDEQNSEEREPAQPTGQVEANAEALVPPDDPPEDPSADKDLGKVVLLAPLDFAPSLRPPGFVLYNGSDMPLSVPLYGVGQEVLGMIQVREDGEWRYAGRATCGTGRRYDELRPGEERRVRVIPLDGGWTAAGPHRIAVSVSGESGFQVLEHRFGVSLPDGGVDLPAGRVDERAMSEQQDMRAMMRQYIRRFPHHSRSRLYTQLLREEAGR